MDSMFIKNKIVKDMCEFVLVNKPFQAKGQQQLTCQSGTVSQAYVASLS
jgi:hypothetical protein